MPAVTPQELSSIETDDIRNICILAHVDHGKTSLTDSLVATNGIISPKQAGRIRYLDSRPDEQEKGITMESSAISLHFGMLRRQGPDDPNPVAKRYLINLIDSPGHIDFSSEVSTASRLCDGAVVLVDAVEGVRSQTVTVLRQVWIEKLRPLLVINKIDRLVTELQMEPEEAYLRLRQVIEQVNAVIGGFFQGDRMEEDLNWRERLDKRVEASAAARLADDLDSLDDSDETPSQADAQFEEKDDEDLYFAPERSNVIFASAIDNYAFTVRQFAAIYEKTLGVKRHNLEKVLWGDFFLDPKTKKVLNRKQLKGKHRQPLFVQLVLDQIWKIYQATVGASVKGVMTQSPELLEKITHSLGIKLPAHVVRSKDPRAQLTAVLSQWLPLSKAVLVSVVESLPSPPISQGERMPKILNESPGFESINPAVRDAVEKCQIDKDNPVVAYVSKMVSVPESEMVDKTKTSQRLSPEEVREMSRKKSAEAAKAAAAAGEVSVVGLAGAMENASLTETPEESYDAEEDPEQLIGFARIYSGTLSVGDWLYVVPPKFSPADEKAAAQLKRVQVTSLYMLMGRHLEGLEAVPAGRVCGIGGLGGHVFKTATLCSVAEGAPNLGSSSDLGEPIVRVTVHPESAADLDKMIQGLEMLAQSDPCAKYEVLENGEYTLLTGGEVHLERCVRDLQERFTKCKIEVSEPRVPLRETIVTAEEMRAPLNEKLGRGVVEATTASGMVTIMLRVRPMPREAGEFLAKNADMIQRLSSNSKLAEEFKEKLEKLLLEERKKDRHVWKGVVDRLSCFGSHGRGPNILIDATKDSLLPHIFDGPSQDTSHTMFAGKIQHAFHLATQEGPLCREPLHGVAVFIDSVSTSTSSEDELHGNLGRLTGEIYKTMKASIHTGFQDWSPRLMLAMYQVEIECDLSVLGKISEVMAQRRGRVVDMGQKEGNSFYFVKAMLPAAESFKFTDHLREHTSGHAQPQLVFVGFEILDEDPLWLPFTEVEMEDLGEFADRENQAKKYMDRVRKEKGMLVTGRGVATVAEKQRTLKK